MVTCNVSPEITDREDPKSTTPYSVPAVAVLPLLLTIKAPATVADPLIEKVALLLELSMLPDEALPKFNVCLTDSL